jgi:single-stranded-DNA-specific exonuclease
MDKAVTRILKAIRNNEKITVYGDYDVDGVTSTVLMVKYSRN